MKNNKSIILSILLSLFLSFSLYSQSGSITACKGEGVKCEVKFTAYNDEGKLETHTIRSVKDKDSAAVIIVIE